jgi:hypothetical protein
LSNKTFAIGTAIVLVSLITCLALFAESYAIVQSINPIAAIAAITVALIGLAWFKRTKGSQ